ncbi:hypothetical protein A2U01_0091686, partial [Trifolium medium]|nr:hypothetical protein [Trifolium medium]
EYEDYLRGATSSFHLESQIEEEPSTGDCRARSFVAAGGR